MKMAIMFHGEIIEFVGYDRILTDDTTRLTLYVSKDEAIDLCLAGGWYTLPDEVKRESRKKDGTNEIEQFHVAVWWADEEGGKEYKAECEDGRCRPLTIDEKMKSKYFEKSSSPPVMGYSFCGAALRVGLAGADRKKAIRDCLLRVYGTGKGKDIFNRWNCSPDGTIAPKELERLQQDRAKMMRVTKSRKRPSKATKKW